MVRVNFPSSAGPWRLHNIRDERQRRGGRTCLQLGACLSEVGMMSNGRDDPVNLFYGWMDSL